MNFSEFMKEYFKEEERQQTQQALDEGLETLFKRRKRRAKKFVGRRRLGSMLRRRNQLRNRITDDNIQVNHGLDGNWGMRNWFGSNRELLYGKKFRLYARYIDNNGNSQYIQVGFNNFRMADIYNDWTTRETSNKEYNFIEATIVFGNINTTNSKKIIKQIFREGVSNCLLTPILKDYEDRLNSCNSKSSKNKYKRKIGICKTLIKKYRNGVPESKLCEICEKLLIGIRIIQPIFNKQLLYISPVRVKAQNTYTYYNTKPNHVDCVDGISFYGKDPIEMEADELQNLYVKTKNNQRKKYYMVQKNKGKVYSLHTLNKSYRIKNPVREIFNKWCKENNITTNLCHHDDFWISDFLTRADYSNGAISFNPKYKKGSFCHIDMQKAYTQGKYNRLYDEEGNIISEEPNPNYMGYLKRIYEFRLTDKERGVGIYLIRNLKIAGNIKNINKYMGIYRKEMILCSPELKYLREQGCSFDIICGVFGEVGDIEFPKYTFEKDNKVPLYSKFIGLLHCSSSDKSITIRDFPGFHKILENQLGENCSDIEKIDGEINLYYRYNRGNHATHIPIFVQAYQRIRLLQQISKMDISNIISIATDGIYYKDHKFEILSPFRYEKKEKIYHGKCASFIPYINPYQYDKLLTNNCWTELNEPRYLDPVYDDEQQEIVPKRANKKFYSKLDKPVDENWGRVEYYEGAGGCGKTHTACCNNLYGTNFIKLAYFAPTHKLRRNVQIKHGTDSFTWAFLDSKDITKQLEIKRKYNVLFIDEVSMMVDSMKERIITNYPNQKIIFAGDIGYQLPPFDNGDNRNQICEFKLTNIDHIIPFRTSYRFKEGDPINDILSDLRKCIKKKINFNFDNYTFQAIKRTKMFKSNMYDIKDLIIAPTHKQKDLYTENYKHLKKWAITKTNNKYSNGDIVIQETEPKNSILQHAYTIHKIQGETTKHKLFIDMERMTDFRMFYTALSRCESLEQVYLVYP